MTRPIEEFRRRAVALDTETALVQDGLLAPPLVIGSFAGPDCPDGLFLTAEQTRAIFVESLRSSDLIVGANIAYDMAVLAADAYAIDTVIVGPDLLREIFAKYDRDEVYDVLIAEALNAIAGGHLFADAATGGPLLDSRGRQSARYSLDITVKQVLGRDDAKVNDFWRLRYAILDQVPLEHWPVEAVQYPKDDARNTLEVAVAQVARHENLHDMPSQARAALALHLASTWGLRADPGRVATLRERVTHERDYEAAQWIDVGFLVDGKKDNHEIKRRLARAYGATGTCPACLGTGKVTSPTSGNQIYCTVKAAGEYACDGTGLDLDRAPLLPRTPTGGIGAGRDELRESGDEDLMGYADWSEDERVLTTYLPFLEKAATGPVNVRPNVLLATGRTSYDGIMQTMPRDSKYWCFQCRRLSKKCKTEGHVTEVCGVRECFAPRPGFYYCSTDYASGELCTLAQVCLWTVGHSDMADVINATRDPGMLHTALAAQMTGASIEEFAARVKAGDKVAKAYRQAAKCFHPDTEVLTRTRGWLSIAEITIDDEIATPRPAVDGASFEMIWARPLRLTTRETTELVHLRNEGMDLRVTPDHRMSAWQRVNYRDGRVTERLVECAPEELNMKRAWPNAGTLGGGVREVDETLLRLAVATQADGCYVGNTIRLGFTKVRKIERLHALLVGLDYDFKVDTAGVTWFTLRSALSTSVRDLLDEKMFPWWWLELTPRCRQIALEEARYWDSHSPPRGVAYTFSSTLKQNIEVLQALASITGLKTRCTIDLRDAEGRASHLDCYKLTVRCTDRSRGGHLVSTCAPYTGPVFCVTTSTDYVLVRDGGVPVITRQCANFGFPGGMGAAKFVLSKRKKAEGQTTGPDGRIYMGIRFCILLDGAERCGEDVITEWRGRACPPVCRRCVVAAENLKQEWLRRWSEMPRYFAWVSERVEATGTLEQFVSRRVRGGLSFCDGANTLFQGLLADGAKRGHWLNTTEMYVVPTSALYGSRAVAFFHDELFSEVPIVGSAPAGERQAALMIEGLKEYVPDVYVACEPALMKKWSKVAETRRDASGTLIPFDT